ncbi:MAG: DUF2460 domain-containing protein [Pseudomonadota bacterium]
MTFHDVRFPGAISFGSSGGVERRTEVIALANGFEERNSPWSQSRRRYDAGLGVRTLDDLDQVLQFFEARQGRLHAFRWKDWLDHRSSPPSAEIGAGDQIQAQGDGVTTTFQLRKVYRSGGFSAFRDIKKPVAGTVRTAVDGIERFEGPGFTVDSATGAITFASAPGTGTFITAGFEFDVPARFDSDVLEVNLAAFEAGEIPSVPVVEVRL